MVMLSDENYVIPAFIAPEKFKSLSLREQDFIVLFYSKNFTREQIQRQLYINSRTSYYRFRKRVTEAIRGGVDGE